MTDSAGKAPAGTSAAGTAGTVAERIAQLRLSPPTRLIAVTKTVSVALIRQAYEAGVRDFGESRIQELEQKQQALADLTDVTWHFIGHLQRNKAKRAVELCPWIHSVDHLPLALRLDQVAATCPQKPKVCLQVKMLEDPNKYGWSVAKLKADLAALQQLQNLEIRGLMTILPLGLTESEILATFVQTRDLARELTQQTGGTLNFQELSMGMSADYPWAVQAGATMVRLGRTLFGERPCRL
jgi:PLP dependent protein